jgi:UDPglucose--hexose-1-phosphate uridylyltransferase
MWIVPSKHTHDFRVITDEQLVDLSKVLRIAIKALNDVADAPSYNFNIRTCPIQAPSEHKELQQYFHWYIDLMPRLWSDSGFELGTGFGTNWTLPETAARFLRRAIASFSQ